MSRLTRYTQKIFGSSAGANQIAKFGSLAAGSPSFTTDPSLIQSLSNYLTGWFGAVQGSNSPAIEDMNALHYLNSYQLAYLMQSGVAEYDSATTYYTGNVVNSAGTLFVSLSNDNTGNALTSTANWKILGGGVRTVTATATALSTDEMIRADATTASFTVTLPTIASCPFRRISVKCINTNTNFVNIAANGSELIDGVNVFYSLTSYESVTLYNNGATWEVVTGNYSKVPVGSVFQFSGTTLPKGYLYCDGALVSRTLYPNLFSAIGTAHGVGDLSTTYALPDYRGRFLRGADNMGTGTAGVDSDVATRTAQTSSTWTKTASITSGSAVVTVDTSVNFAVGMTVTGTGIPASTTIAAILTSTTVQLSANATATNASVTLTLSKSVVGNNVGSVQADLYASHNHNQWGENGSGTIYPSVSNSAAGPTLTGVYPNAGTVSTGSYKWITTEGSGGSETRPKNSSVKFIIKY